MRESSSQKAQGSYVISKLSKLRGQPPTVEHFEVERVDRGYRIKVENKHDPMSTLSEVMSFFMFTAGVETTVLMKSNHLTDFGLSDDGDTDPYNMKKIERVDPNQEPPVSVKPGNSSLEQAIQQVKLRPTSNVGATKEENKTAVKSPKASATSPVTKSSSQMEDKVLTPQQMGLRPTPKREPEKALPSASVTQQLEERSQQHVAQLNELEFALESLQTRSEKKDIAIAVLSDVVDKLTNQIDLLTNAAENRSQVSDIDCADPDSESTSPVSETPAQQDDENEVGLEETVVCTKREEEPKESQTRRQPKEAVNTTRSENRRNEDVVKRLSHTAEARRSISPENRHSRTEEKEWDSNIEWTLPDPVPVQEQPIKHVSLGHWIDIANEEIANGKAFSVGNGCGPCTVLCFDVSDSMKGDPFRHMIILGLRFVKERLRPGGPSPLMGAVALAFGCVRGTMKPHKTVPSRVIFFTDGLVTQSAITGGPDMFSRTENLAKLMEIDQECMAHQENILPQMRKEHIRIHFVPLGAAVINPHMLSVSKKTNGRIVRPKDIDRLTKHSQYAMMVTKLKEAKKTGKEFELPDDLTSDDMDELQELMRFDPSVTTDDSDESGSEQGDGQTANSENDPNMPPLGTRVRRGPDWNSNWDHQDSNGPGTVVSHTKKGWIWIMWDNGHRNQYPYGKNGNFGVIAVDEPRILEQNQLIEPGCLVTRGPDWRDNDKDGGAGSVGAVFRKHHDGSVGVRWPSGIMRRYKFGKGGFFEVKICDPYDPEVQAAVASGGKTKVSLKDPTLDDTVNEEDVKKKPTAHAQKNTSIDEMNKRNAMKQTIGETSGRNSTEENKQNVSNFDEKTQTVDKSVEEMNRRNTVQNKSPGKSSTSLVEEMNMRNANKGPPDGLDRDDTDIDGPKEDVELTDDGHAKELGGIKEVVIPEDKRGNDKSFHSDCKEEMDTTLDMTNKDVRTNENLTDQTQSDKHGSMHESRRDDSDGQNSEIRNVNENLLGAKPKVPSKGQVNMTDTIKDGQMRQDVHEVRTKMNGKTVKSEKERKKDNAMLATSLRTSSFDEPDEEEITNVFTPPQITQDHVTTESKNRTGTLSTMGNVPNISANSHLQKSSNLSNLKDNNTDDLDLDGGDHDLTFEHNSLPSPVASDDGSSRKMSMTSSGTQSVVEDLSSSFSSEASSHSREEDADGQQDDDVVWQRKGENGGWVNFSPDVSAKIERAYRRNPKTTTSYLENKKRRLCGFSPPAEKPNLNVLCLGLTKSGKSTLLAVLSGEGLDEVQPTVGFSIKALMFDDCILDVKELGGGENVRPYWDRYFSGSQGVVFVVNSAASEEEMTQANTELHKALADPELDGLPLLLLCNFSDVDGARSTSQVEEKLEVRLETGHRECVIASCSTKDKDSIKSAFLKYNKILMANRAKSKEAKDGEFDSV
ncbi:hypothetical protein FSP39_013395 [Pinctada imbricata]|uniref:MIB/HERC2 domain-containing protein n=1 Tax=Pinctada imbricata TaxID=66713 RepID=A0AA88YAS5_PINIB|nr:hypothetical protein FSP39_013395 [Pinctada imbricata]